MSPSTSVAFAEKPIAYYSPLREDIAAILPCTVNRCLEVGCGTGSTLCWVKQKFGAETLGVELNEDAAELARRAADRIIVGNIETDRIDLPGCDLILCLDVLEHLVDPWSTLQKLSRVLVPGGCIIASIPNVQHFTVSLNLLRGRWNYTPHGLLDSTHLRFFTYSTIREMFIRAGLDVKISRRIAGKSVLANRLSLGLFHNFFAYQYYVKGMAPFEL
jgi:2-polyprenyl-3-methyl-5-hydroxy-6-metoxy-1,4-benzoquinol methylase